MKRLAILALLALVLVAVGLSVTLHYRDKGRQARTAPGATPALSAIEGRLSIVSLSEFRVAGKAIVLCGVANQKPASLQPLLIDAARKALNGQEVRCVPVGQGTPCDGNSAASFGRMAVMQCKTAAGVDVAGDLAERGILCGLPAQAGGAYRSC